MTQNQHGTQHMPERGFDDNLEAARPLLAAHFIASLGLNLREVAKSSSHTTTEPTAAWHSVSELSTQPLLQGYLYGEFADSRIHEHTNSHMHRCSHSDKR